MPKIEKSITINAPLEEVFPYINDPNNFPEIWPSMVEVKEVNQVPEGVGSSWKWVYKMAGMRFKGSSEVTEFFANHRIIYKHKGGIAATSSVEVKPVDGGTKYTAVIEYTVPIPLLGKLAEAFIRRLNENEMDVLLSNLKARMEN